VSAPASVPVSAPVCAALSPPHPVREAAAIVMQQSMANIFFFIPYPPLIIYRYPLLRS
jgi:hypothetical protein